MEQNYPLQAAQVVKLDFDNPNDLDLKRIKFVLTQLDYEAEYAAVFNSPSGKGYHVYITLAFPQVCTDLMLVLIQSLCGSDYKREVMNSHRVFNNEQNWNKLFEYSWKNKQGKLKQNGCEILNKPLTKKLNQLLLMR